MSQVPINKRAFVYQIFYDEPSKAMLDPGFIPLDNMANERPDWYEFWVIYQFLMQNDLQPDCWYGFLSPRFNKKTGFTSQMVFETLQQSNDGEVALFSPYWDWAAFYLNVFEQAERKYAGLTSLAQEFCNEIGLDVQLQKLVNTASNTVFCNYIVAKPRFWDRWLWMADNFFELAEYKEPEKYSQVMQHRSSAGVPPAPMKVFIQERFASIILATEKFCVVTPVPNQVPLLMNPIFNFDEDTVQKLLICEQLKSEFNKSDNFEYLKKFQQVRESISFRKPSGT